MGHGEGVGEGVGEGTGYGVGSGLMRCFLIVVNILFGLIGFVLLAGGAFLLGGTSLYMPMLDQIAADIPSLVGASYADAGTSDTALTVDFGAIINGVAIGLLIIGLVLFVMAILGCIGACCSVKIVLIIYCVVLIIMFLVQLVLIIVYATGGLDSLIKGKLEELIGTYKGMDDFSTNGILLNVLMMQFKCCGINNYLDFTIDMAPDWKRTRQVEVYAGITVDVNLQTPLSCCKNKDAFPTVNFVNPKTCAVSPLPDGSDNNFNTGCFDAMNGEIEPYNNIIIGVFAGILVFQAILIAFVIALLVLKSKDDDKIV